MVVLSEVKRRKRISSWGMGARGRSSRYSCSKTATREVGAGDFFARGCLIRGLGVGGWGIVAAPSGKSIGGIAGDDEKSCRNWRRGDGPGCFGVVRVLVLGAELSLLDQTLFSGCYQGVFLSVGFT